MGPCGQRRLSPVHARSAPVTTMAEGAVCMDTLRGRAYAITGGNSGIGRATAQELARRGAQVAIFGRDRETLEATQRELGAGALALQGDVRSGDDLRRFFDAIARHFDGLDGRVEATRLARCAIPQRDEACCSHPYKAISILQSLR